MLASLLVFLLGASGGGSLTGQPCINCVSATPGNASTNPSGLSFYVDGTNGSDGNGCTSAAAACATIQAAVNKVPKLLRDLVTVNIAAGSYSGFYVSGFTMDIGVQQTTGGLYFLGALANSTGLASGTATGTATAGSAGSAATFGTLTDSGQTWTINNLQGKFIVITGGTGSGQVRTIVSNTATAITIAGTWTAPTGTSTYAVQDSSVNINTLVNIPPTGTAAALANQLLLFVVNNTINYAATAMTFRNIKFTNSSGTGVRIRDASWMQFLEDQFVQTNVSGVVAGGGTTGPIGTITFSDCAFSNTSSGSSIILSSAMGTISRSFFSGGGIGLNLVAPPGTFSIDSIQTSGHTGAGVLSLTGPGAFNLTSSNLTGSGIVVKASIRSKVTNFLNNTVSGGGTPILVTEGSSLSFGATSVTCSANTGNVVQVGELTSGASPAFTGSYSQINSAAALGTGCGTVLGVYGPGNSGEISSPVLTGTVQHTAQAVNGGTVFFNATGVGSLTVSSTEMGLDNLASTTTAASINSADCFSSVTTGSRICRQ